MEGTLDKAPPRASHLTNDGCDPNHFSQPKYHLGALSSLTAVFLHLGVVGEGCVPTHFLGVPELHQWLTAPLGRNAPGDHSLSAEDLGDPTLVWPAAGLLHRCHAAPHRASQAVGNTTS